MVQALTAQQITRNMIPLERELDALKELAVEYPTSQAVSDSVRDCTEQLRLNSEIVPRSP